MTDKKDLEKFTDRELFAYFNILRFPALRSSEDAAYNQKHLTLVKEILSERKYGAIVEEAISKNVRIRKEK